MGKKCEKPCSVFGLWPSVSFCSASAKNFHFGASLVIRDARYWIFADILKCCLSCAEIINKLFFNFD